MPRLSVGVDGALLEHDADPLAEFDTCARRVYAEYLDLTLIRAEIALQDLHRGGLAGPVRAQEREHLTGRHLEIEPAHGRGAAVRLLAAAGSPDPARHARMLIAWSEGVMFDTLAGAGAGHIPSVEELRTSLAELMAGMVPAGPER